MTPDIQIHNCDCMDYMKSCKDHEFDLAIVDPPYFEGPQKTGYYGKGYSNLGVPRAKYYQGTEEWEIPKEDYFIELKRVSKNQIIWGANHFAGVFNSSSQCWIVWDKDNGKSSFADCELAYTSFDKAARLFKYMWNGMHQGSHSGNVKLNEKRIHTTQKPVKLYQWLLENYAVPGQRIIDTHLGSGSSAIASYYFGCEFVGCEKDEYYYKAGKNRIEIETLQLSMFSRGS